MSLSREKTKAAFDRALQVMPSGVNSNFRYWGDDDSLVIERGEGAYIWDMDGNRYIDYRLGFGPIILGHAHPAVTNAVTEAIKNGTVFALTTPNEIEAAERIIDMCPGVDMVRFANSGTEATMHALRIARGYTNRERFIKFEGCYHGMHDYVLFSTASAHPAGIGAPYAPVNMQASSGIPKGISQYVTNLPYNDIGMLEKTVEEQWQDLAAILVEPMMGNGAGILPEPGFLEKMRELCDKYGIVMIMDEVKTGFRIAKGGATEYFGVEGDLMTYAKSLGNGFPVAAIGGHKDIMSKVGPGKIAHGGTYAGNGVATAAAVATLKVIAEEDPLGTINLRGQQLMSGVSEILHDADIPHVITGIPAAFGLYLGSDEKPTDFRSFMKGDMQMYEDIMMHMIDGGGPFPEADAREPWFLCAALSERDVAETLTAFEDAVKTVKK